VLVGNRVDGWGDTTSYPKIGPNSVLIGSKLSLFQNPIGFVSSCGLKSVGTTGHGPVFLFQKEKGNRLPPNHLVIVKKKLDGTISILWNGKPLKIKKLLHKKEANQPVSDVA
jgi:hypothetical protein